MGTSALAFLAERLASFGGELGRRRVWRAALTYAAVVFVILQMGEIVFPAFSAPPWALKLTVVLSFLGFPPVLCLAWVFDLTPRGIRRTEGSEEGTSAAFPTAALPRLALLAVTLATVGGLGWWTVEDTLQTEIPSRDPAGGEPLLAAASGEDTPVVTSLAVLPLDDLGQEEAKGDFAAGFHESLIAELSRIQGVRVVSRTSAVSFDRTGKAMPAIARELGVEGVLEGSVFRDGDRIRITVQLIHGPQDSHLWAESYEGTMDDPIALQREVAEAVARELRERFFPQLSTQPSPERRGKPGEHRLAEDVRGQKVW